jgi:hypothetical protein
MGGPQREGSSPEAGGLLPPRGRLHGVQKPLAGQPSLPAPRQDGPCARRYDPRLPGPEVYESGDSFGGERRKEADGCGHCA